ncbi:hypothetical protein H4R33_000964 [Dimargaris cristalligena]|nr:hypothetical protein H4R33_000964 [Dimargaris cristalligena]
MTTDVSTLGSLVRASEALTPGHAELFTATHLPHLEAVVDQFIKRSGRGDLTAADSVPLALQVLANASRYGAPLLNLYIQSRPEAAAFTALAVQTLRLIANLVADHEPNRNLILQLGIPHHLVALVKDHAIPIDVLRAALGAMLNASLDYEPCQKSLIEQTAIEALVGTFQNPARIVDHDMVVNLVIRNLSNLAEQEASLSHFHSTTAATTIIGLAAVYKPVFQGPMGQEVFMDLLSLLEALLRHPPIQVDVVRNGKLVTLLDLVEVLVLGQLQVPASEATDASAPIARALESLSLDSDDEEEAGEEKTSPSPAGATDSSPKTQAIDLLSQTLVSVTSNDDNMDRLLEDPAVFSRLRTWLWLRPSSVETEPDLTSKKDPKKLAARTGQLQTLAALCIGNVARSDKICLAVVQEHRIGPALVDLLKETKDYRIQHAVTGLLRNLTIPEPNKRVFGQTPLIPLVARLVDTKIAPLQMNVIRILKHLVSYNQSPNTLQMVQPLGIDSAPAMVHSVAQAAAAVTRAMEDEQDEIDLFRNTPLGLLIGVLGDNYPEPIYCEGGRVVADVVKTAFTAQDDAATQTRLILSNQLAQLIPPLAFLLTQAKFQVLQHEAIFALSLLMHHADTTSCMRALERCLAPVSSGPQASTSDGPVGQAPPQPMATVDWLAKLIDLAGDGQKAAESRSNALKLLLSLSTDLLSHSEGLVLMKAGLLTINQTNIPCPKENLYLLAPEQEVFRYTSELHTELAKLHSLACPEWTHVRLEYRANLAQCYPGISANWMGSTDADPLYGLSEPLATSTPTLVKALGEHLPLGPQEVAKRTGGDPELKGDLPTSPLDQRNEVDVPTSRSWKWFQWFRSTQHQLSLRNPQSKGICQQDHHMASRPSDSGEAHNDQQRYCNPGPSNTHRSNPDYNHPVIGRRRRPLDRSPHHRRTQRQMGYSNLPQESPSRSPRSIRPGLLSPLYTNRRKNRADRIRDDFLQKVGDHHYVIHAFFAKTDQELTLHKGDHIEIQMAYNDGWTVGYNHTTKKCGYPARLYASPAHTSDQSLLPQSILRTDHSYLTARTTPLAPRRLQTHISEEAKK